jgi:hypothetical protein
MESWPIPDPFEFQYLTREPPAPLRRTVESIWYARGTVPYVRERIVPSGSMVAVVVLGDLIIETPDDGRGPALRAERGSLIGPHDRPVLNEPTGETRDRMARSHPCAVRHHRWP